MDARLDDAGFDFDADRLLEHASALRRLARRLARDASEADDLLQDTWTRAIESPPHAASGSGSLRAWLRTVLRNRHRELRRTESLQREHEPTVARPVGVEPDAGELEERLKLHSALARALLELPEPCRAAVTLRFLDGHSGIEVARLQGISHDALRQRLARGMSLLRERLDRELGPRRSWVLLALSDAPKAVPHPIPSTLLTATAMSTTTKITAAAIVLVLSLAAIGAWIALEPLKPNETALVHVGGQTLSPSDSQPATAMDAEHRRAPIENPSIAGVVVPSAIDREHDLHGLVVGPDDAPIAGATVRIARCAASGWHTDDVAEFEDYVPISKAITPADGSFVIPLERGRPYELFVDAQGFAPAHLAQRNAGERVVVHLGPAGALDVRVVRADGTPLHPGRVELVCAPQDAPDERWTLTRAELDADGHALVVGLPCQELSVQVVPADSTWPTWSDVHIAQGAPTKLTITLPKGDEVRGRVVDARTKRPISGARVGAPAWFGRGVLSDLDGAFVIPSLSEEFGLLQVDAAGYAHGKVNVRDGHDGVLSPVTIELRAGRRVRGRVVDLAGSPVAAVYVAATGSIWRDRFMQHDWIGSRTDDTGRFELAGLDPELAHVLIARKDGVGASVFDLPSYEAESESVEVGDLVLRPPAFLAGSVRDTSGTPIAGTRVVLSGTNADRGSLPGAVRAEIDAAPAQRHTRTDDLGRFAFADVAAGDYTLNAPGDADLSPSPGVAVHVSTGEQRSDFDLRCTAALSIRGRVLAHDGQPVAAVLRVVPVGPHERSYATEVETDGSFVARGLQPGLHDLVVQPGAATAPPFVLRADAGSKDVVVRLPELDFVRGRILGEDGRPNAKAYVQLVDPACEQSLSSCESGADGAFELPVARGAHVRLEAYSRRLPDGTKLRASLPDISAGSTLDVTVRRPQ